MDTKQLLQKLTNHQHITITTRGNAAIKAAIRLAGGKILVPEEGGWLSYKKSDFQAVKCQDSVIDLRDLEKKLSTKNFTALIYMNPGGYFANQPMKQIYQLCQKYKCLVILDVSGGIGTDMCDGNFADIIVCSFGRWKLIDVGGTGFISFKTEELAKKATVTAIDDPRVISIIKEKIEKLPSRINFIMERRRKVGKDLSKFNILHKEDEAPNLVVAFKNLEEKKKIIAYCEQHELEYTECPRYIRVNKQAISIEIKRLST
jgi:hypothetical protein